MVASVVSAPRHSIAGPRRAQYRSRQQWCRSRISYWLTPKKGTKGAHQRGEGSMSL